MDKISVIVPVYNVERFLPKCVDSILAQSYTELEIILVDDGSQDGSCTICEAYAARDARIKVVRITHGGVSVARNAGLDAATGDYIAFVDSDDYIVPEMFELLHSLAVENDVKLSACAFYCVDIDGKLLDIGMKQPEAPAIWTREDFWHAYRDGLDGFCVVLWNKLYKRELFASERFDCGKLHEDAYICHRIIEQCDFIACTNKPCLYYLQHGGSITSAKTLTNHLMSLDALLLRTEYYINAGCADFACIALRDSVKLCIKLNDSCADMKAEDKKLWQGYFKRYRACCLKLLFKAAPLKTIISTAICALSPALAKCLLR